MEQFLKMLTGAAEGSLGILSISLRLLCAMLIGLVIGTEREYTKRPVGMRTHILVALGACSVMITGELLFRQYSALGATPDPARLSAQVITGVGFLGAGTIMREGSNVKGLTTAASLWAVACLGIAAGAGYYAVALLGMVFIFVTLTIFEVLQNKLVDPAGALCYYSVTAVDVAQGLNAIHDLSNKHRIAIRDLYTRPLETGYEICFHGETGGAGARKRREKFLAALAIEPGFCGVTVEEKETLNV